MSKELANSREKCISKCRKYYLEIINYPADCGHHMLRMLRPTPYRKLSEWWDRLEDVDPAAAEHKPDWL